MYKKIKEEYKGFCVEYTKTLKDSFYNIGGIIYKNKNYREEEYFSFYLENSYTKTIKDAKKDAHKYIDELKNIPFVSNGLINALYLPSINKK